MNSQAVEIEILGRQTRVNCPVGQEESLKQAANELNNRLADMSTRSKGSSDLQIMTIAALNACYELCIQQRETLDRSTVETRINNITAQLDAALTTSNE
ncbi:cell division protein ZapA [Vibrio sp.]|nr:cell division protein ZapA [Vibrio sp.]